MKNIIKITMLLITLGCKAQSPIYNLCEYKVSSEPGCYNKDVDGVLPEYEGEYLYTNTVTNTTLRIKLVSKIMDYNSKYYEDLLIGAYEYKVNGVIKVSTMADLTTSFPLNHTHYIEGNGIMNFGGSPTWENNKKRIFLGFRDPYTTRWGRMFITKTTQGGLPAIKILIFAVGGANYMAGQSEPPLFKVPEGEYTLIKQ
jgi:hypothetical protein